MLHSLAHELGGGDLEHGWVDVSELFNGERPAVEAGTEAHRAFGGVHTHLTHGTGVVVVCGDDHVHVLNDTLQDKTR